MNIKNIFPSSKGADRNKTEVIDFTPCEITIKIIEKIDSLLKTGEHKVDYFCPVKQNLCFGIEGQIYFRISGKSIGFRYSLRIKDICASTLYAGVENANLNTDFIYEYLRAIYSKEEEIRLAATNAKNNKIMREYLCIEDSN